MDDLPPPLILDILSRLTDSTDLAMCRLASKTLNALSYEVRSLSLLCSLSRYLKCRSPSTNSQMTPFKSIFKSLVFSSRNLESVSLGVDKALGGISFDDAEDESDDLYLTDVDFVKEWLPLVCEGLKVLSISDFWIQSCWRRSELLALISSLCLGLLKLEVKNAWLSVDGLQPMHTLTSLTLEFIRLDDEDLDKVNTCFAFLQVLNLIGVGGLKEPKICLLHLKTCQWTVSNAPLSLTILAPNLVYLKLKCIKPKFIVLETPLLSDFHLSLEKENEFKVKGFPNLKNLQLESSSLCSLIGMFLHCEALKKLTLDSLKWPEPIETTKFSLETLFDVFPNVSSLTLGPGAWSKVETSYCKGGLKGQIRSMGLKEIIAHLVVHDIDVSMSFIFSILDNCTSLSDMSLLIHHGVDSNIGNKLISRCTADFPRVRWRWGMWKEGTKDTWVSDGI